MVVGGQGSTDFGDRVCLYDCVVEGQKASKDEGGQESSRDVGEQEASSVVGGKRMQALWWEQETSIVV